MSFDSCIENVGPSMLNATVRSGNAKRGPDRSVYTVVTTRIRFRCDCDSIGRTTRIRLQFDRATTIRYDRRRCDL